MYLRRHRAIATIIDHLAVPSTGVMKIEDNRTEHRFKLRIGNITYSFGKKHHCPLTSGIKMYKENELLFETKPLTWYTG